MPPISTSKTSLGYAFSPSALLLSSGLCYFSPGQPWCLLGTSLPSGCWGLIKPFSAGSQRDDLCSLPRTVPILLGKHSAPQLIFLKFTFLFIAQPTLMAIIDLPEVNPNSAGPMETFLQISGLGNRERVPNMYGALRVHPRAKYLMDIISFDPHNIRLLLLLSPIPRQGHGRQRN